MQAACRQPKQKNPVLGDSLGDTFPKLIVEACIFELQTRSLFCILRLCFDWIPSASVHSSCSDSSSVGSQKEGGSPASGRDPRSSSGSTSYSQVGSQFIHPTSVIPGWMKAISLGRNYSLQRGYMYLCSTFLFMFSLLEMDPFFSGTGSLNTQQGKIQTSNP